MKTKTVYKLLEGSFLFMLILMMYIMSVFTAKGQMTRELSTPLELQLTYNNEHSFIQERIVYHAISQLDEPEALYTTRMTDATQTIETPIDSSRLSGIRVRMRRQQSHYQAPAFFIPLN